MSVQRTHPAVCLCGALFLLAIQSTYAQDEGSSVPLRAELISVRRIWDEAQHNAFTDLVRWRDRFYCAFREGKGHAGDIGKLRLIESRDGEDWRSAYLFEKEGYDLRDAAVSVTPDKRLLVLGGAQRVVDGKSSTGTFISFSDPAGATWTAPEIVVPLGRWLWRVTWHEGKAYGVSYAASAGKPFSSLLVSDDGRTYRAHVEKLLGEGGWPTEARLRFAEDGTAFCLHRRDGRSGNTAYLGRARPPYTEWTWKDLKMRFGGPNFLRLPSGHWVGAGRRYEGGATTVLTYLDVEKGTMTPFLKLPSGGDTSYPGLVWHGNELWVSYYASHESKTSIYLARVRLQEKAEKPKETASPAARAGGVWSQWRGPLGTGVAPDADPPLEWSESKNVRWKTALPGKGHSTPIAWGDRLFLTTAVPYGEKLPPQPETAPGAHDNVLVTQRHQYDVLAVSRDDGRILWQKTVHRALPHEGGHYTGSLASASPVTDGERVVAFFGTPGLFCLDFNGKLLWQKSLGRMQTKHGHGEGSSPALHGSTIVVNWDHEAESFVVALDIRDGRELWRVPRDEVTSWTSPTVTVHEGRPQAVVSGTERIRGYDLRDGKVLWECGGLSHNVVATPVVGHGMVFAASSYETRAILAIRLDGAEGDVTNSDHVAWRRVQRTPYVPSPLLYGKSLYYLRHYQGILSRVRVETGEDEVPPLRLPGIRNVYASPVGAAGRVYVTDLDGTTLVVRHSGSPEILAQNQLDDSFSASPVPLGDQLYLRGERYLYCIVRDE